MARLKDEMLDNVIEHPISGEEFFAGTLGKELEVNNAHLISLTRAALPIIFVPGIMASRLYRPENPDVFCWDPDDRAGSVKNLAHAEPFDKYRRLARNINGLEPNENDAAHNLSAFGRKYPHGAARGWGGIYWGGYEKLITTLDDWATSLKLLIDMPVYAFGYNWMQSNDKSGKKLAKRIEDILAKHPGATQVLLVTHSMGGMVARAACEIHEMEEKVFGVVHGAQPSLGTVDAYTRMIAGQWSGWGFFEMVGAMVIGTSGPHITAILAHSGGGLELLPTTHYHVDPRRTPEGSTQKDWLHVIDARHKEHSHASHPAEDPYKAIYLEEEKCWRLIHKEWLQPSPGEWNRVKKKIDDARGFHDDLKLYCHPRTIQLYSSGNPTFCEAIWIFEDKTEEIRAEMKKIYEPLDVHRLDKYRVNMFGRLSELVVLKSPAESPEDATPITQPFTFYDTMPGGFLRELLRTEHRIVQRRLALLEERLDGLPRADKGDGTVPEASGRGLTPEKDAWPAEAQRFLDQAGEKSCTRMTTSAEHAVFYDTPSSMAARYSLHNLARAWLEENLDKIKAEKINCNLGCLEQDTDHVPGIPASPFPRPPAAPSPAAPPPAEPEVDLGESYKNHSNRWPMP